MEQCLLRTRPKSQAKQQVLVQLLSASCVLWGIFTKAQCAVSVPCRGSRAPKGALLHRLLFNHTLQRQGRTALPRKCWEAAGGCTSLAQSQLSSVDPLSHPELSHLFLVQPLHRENLEHL